MRRRPGRASCSITLPSSLAPFQEHSHKFHRTPLHPDQRFCRSAQDAYGPEFQPSTFLFHFRFRLQTQRSERAVKKMKETDERSGLRTYTPSSCTFVPFVEKTVFAFCLRAPRTKTYYPEQDIVDMGPALSRHCFVATKRLLAMTDGISVSTVFRSQ